ncbi:MAG TPA: NYN domain-containing protein [Pseudonocardiaceae bacterium]
MRSHCALYVDAGYLLAASATRITGTSLRSSIEADHERLIDALIAHATERSGLPLLRVHWYDAARDGVPDDSQQKIGLLPRVKLRLGRIGFDGEQKGVDLRIGLDLVAHARNAAVDAVFLVSGDDDLAEAVEEAQALGVQVTILAVPNKSGEPHGVSRHLQGAADGLDLLTGEALDAAVKPRTAVLEPTPVATPAVTVPRPVPVPGPSQVPTPTLLANRPIAPKPAVPMTPTAPATPATRPIRTGAGLVYSSTTGLGTTTGSEIVKAEDLKTIDEVVTRVLNTWLDGRTAEQRDELTASRPSIPQDVDRALLLDLSDALGVYYLSDTIRYRLRARFWAKVDESEQTSS